MTKYPKQQTSRPTCPITHDRLFKTRGKPGKPPSNYTPRVRRKYIISKVKFGSPDVCNSLEPNTHAGSQPFRYVSAGSTYCHFDPHLKYPPPLRKRRYLSTSTDIETPPGRIPNLPLHKDIFMCYICPNCRRSLR
jgi:hypothetical protein